MTPAAMRLRQGSESCVCKPCRDAGFFCAQARFAGGLGRGTISVEQAFQIAAVWLGLAVLSTILAAHLRVSMALMEICVGMVAAMVADGWFSPGALGAESDWLRFLASTGAVVLTFLAGAELDPAAMRTKLKEVSVVGLMGLLGPFLGCTAVARLRLGWRGRPVGWRASPFRPPRWLWCTP